MAAFSDALRYDCYRLHGFDPEMSLREWLYRITGKTGSDLAALVADGAEVARIIEEEEARMVNQGTRLTPYEIRALAAWSEEGTIKAAAQKLGVSRWTIQHQLKFARTRLGVHTTAQAVRIAIRTGQMAA